jgi:hypothetical protein
MAVFRRKRKSAPPLSPAREALIAADSALAAGRVRLSEAEARVVRLRGIVDAASPADAALRSAIAADGGEELARLSRGEQSEIAGLADAADAAKRAAGIAASGLPESEEELHQANEDLGQLIDARRRAIDDVLIVEADSVGAAYSAAFDHLMKLYERLAGIDTALSGKIAFAAPEPQEMPRFRLRSLPTQPERLLDGNMSPVGGTFSPFLRRVPDNQRIAGHAAAWRRAARALIENPHVDLSELAAADAVELSSIESGLVRHDKRPAAQEAPGFVEMLVYEGTTAMVPVVPDHDMSQRKRRHQVLSSDVA